jgi:hypothetical protein
MRSCKVFQSMNCHRSVLSNYIVITTMISIKSIDIVKFIVSIYVLQASLCLGTIAWHGKMIARNEKEMCKHILPDFETSNLDK